MTLDRGWIDEPFTEQNESPNLGEMPEHPVHVKVTNTQTQRVAAEFSAWQRFIIPTVGGSPVQLCPHRYHRLKAIFTIDVIQNGVLFLGNQPDVLAGTTNNGTLGSSTLLSQPANVWSFSILTHASAPYSTGTVSGAIPDYEAMQPLYAIWSGTYGALAINVLDMTYGTVQ